MVHMQGKVITAGLKRWMKNIEKNFNKASGQTSDAQSINYELNRWMTDMEKDIKAIKQKLQMP